MGSERVLLPIVDFTRAYDILSHAWVALLERPIVLLCATFMLAASMTHSRCLQAKGQNTFPPWAVVEIALTGVILSKGGFLQMA